MSKIYVGEIRGGGREVFRSETVPTYESHGKQYFGAIGPFRTVRGANFARDYGALNPHCRSVSDAERLAKLKELEQKRVIS